MGKQAETNYNLVDYILSLTETSAEENAAGSPPLENGSSADESGMEKRRIAEQMLEIINHMPGGFFLYHADGDEALIYVNEGMLRIFGCDTEEEFRELTGNSFRGIVHPDDLEHVEKSIQEQIDSSQYDLDYVEYRIIQKSGKIRWVEDYGHFVHSRYAGDIFYVFIGDATEKRQRQMEQMAVIISEGLSNDYETIFYADLDADRLIPYRVGAIARGYMEKVGTPYPFAGYDKAYIQKWVLEEDRGMLAQATSLEYIRRRLSSEKSYHVNYRIRREGHTEYRQLRIVNIGSWSHISQIVVGYRSVDEEIRQEIEQTRVFQNALAQARSAIIAKNTFLANMSHDIRTPMNAIVGFTALAKNAASNETVLNYLDRIETASSQLLKLLNDVLEISRLEAGKIQIEEKPCDLLDILKNVQMAVHPWATEKKIDFSLDVSQVHHYEIYGDGQKLEQILLRLTKNAIKYTAAGGKITVAIVELYEQLQSYATYQFIVEDNGIGISEEFQKHIFEPFEREQNTTLSGVQGTGLGLTIIRNMINLMEGDIEVQSVPGKGSKFTVTLAFRLHNETEKRGEKEDVFYGPVGNKKILLVEDNEINVEIATELLKNVGFRVDTALNGKIAVEKVAKEKPEEYDLILMDIQMPVMDGYQAARLIRGMEDPKRAGIPIVAVSANTFDEDKKLSMESGMNAHIGKPIDISELLLLIRELIYKKESGTL